MRKNRANSDGQSTHLETGYDYEDESEHIIDQPLLDEAGKPVPHRRTYGILALQHLAKYKTGITGPSRTADAYAYVAAGA